MDGFINVNKAAGMTSFDVIKKLKKVFPKTKLGHLGTLDPMALGVLPVAIGYATRVIEYVSEKNKVYFAAMTLGGVSDTQDAWGNIVYSGNINFNAGHLPDILNKYTGNIRQIPPMYSAIHHNGARLYELARQGITVERESREIVIEYINLLSTDIDTEGRPLINLEVGCSKGTYIRTLCHDIGAELGTGAYLSELTRSRAGMFAIENSYSLEEINQHIACLSDLIKAVDFPLMHLGKIEVNSEDLDKVLNGNRITMDEKIPPGIVRVYDPQGRLVSIAQCSVDENRRLLQPIKVFK
ncbi:MAG: tRNA pseudouridine(55) synthase TruB [Firmicutes bacterium HGW-Firmicutes-15]|nr:MAG: tRNA pseudouridine(55) synthase TruB [Firmicutes bacterium HGW-Firmicutes-15]